MARAVSRYYPSRDEIGQHHQLQGVSNRFDRQLNAHWLDVTCSCDVVMSVPADGGDVDVVQAHARHIHAVWLAANTIDDPTDLEMLPDSTVIDDSGAVGVRMGGLWYFVGVAEPFEPNLPVTLVRWGDGSFDSVDY